MRTLPNGQPENPEITRVTAEHQQAQGDDGDDGHDNPAGDTGSSERGFVVPFRNPRPALDLKRRFPSGVSYRFDALSRFGPRIETG
jgi:hypothetical protein